MEKSCNINPRVLRYMQMVERGEIRACDDQKFLATHVRRCFETEDIYTDDQQLEQYIKLAKYFPFDKIFEWQEFVLALHLCTYWKQNNMPRWPDLLCMIGRGAGKDGTIALESMCLISPYNGIAGYDVDICANNEDQGLRPVKDLIETLERPAHIKKMKRFFYWNRENVICTKTRSTVKGHTNSPKGKDGLRSGVVILNEIHQYQNYDNINVFTTGLGKKKHPRRSYFTTQGNVRDGPLDHMLETAEGILRHGEPDNGLLPFICRLNRKEEVHDPANWAMATPSLPYLPHLQAETQKEYEQWKKNPEQLTDFMTKRMNLPQENVEIAVTEWKYIKAATAKALPDLRGESCVIGIDYAKLTDWASIDLHFRIENMRVDLSHSWLCSQSKDLPRIRAPWKQWAKDGLLTVVDDVEISPRLLTEHIECMAELYSIEGVALDSYRYALLAEYLRQIGFDAKDRKNLKLVRPSDIMQVVPVIESCFVNELFTWGENPMLRWATNNAKLIRAGRSGGTDTGNFVYGKIEAKSRKTDPFMAIAASMTIEEKLERAQRGSVPDVGVMVY